LIEKSIFERCDEYLSFFVMLMLLKNLFIILNIEILNIFTDFGRVNENEEGKINIL
jgi:hypothetical protein